MNTIFERHLRIWYQRIGAMELYMVPSLEHGAQSLKKVFCVTVILCSLDLDM